MTTMMTAIVFVVGGCDEREAVPRPRTAPAPVTPIETHAPARAPDPAPPSSPSSPSRAVSSDAAAPPRVDHEALPEGLRDFVATRENRGLLWAGPMRGNGGREVVVYLPPDADPVAEYRLVYHFHGTYSERVERRRPGVPKKRWVGWARLQQTLDAVDELQRSRPYNVALVYPFSAGKRKEPDRRGYFNRAYDRMWMLPSGPDFTDSFATLDDEVRRLLSYSFRIRPTAIAREVIAEGHSAGGIALRNIARSGVDNVGEYIFLDASFEGWADGCYAETRKLERPARISIVMTEGGIADPFGRHDPWCARLEGQAGEWEEQKTRCATLLERSGDAAGDEADARARCSTLRGAAAEWRDGRERWCEELKNDMRDLEGVYVHRTRVYHGDQPRHFSGGLELPSGRFSAPI